MAVVINDFEVVPESAPAPAASSGTSSQPAKQPPEVERLLAQHHARAARVRAY